VVPARGQERVALEVGGWVSEWVSGWVGEWMGGWVGVDGWVCECVDG
jgi:hypothetical protein